MAIDNSGGATFGLQLWILTKRLLIRVIRRPYTELPTVLISAFFLFVYVGQLDKVFGGSAMPSSIDFSKGNFVNFILPFSIVSASISGASSGINLVEDIESGVFRRYQAMPISRWAVILAPMLVGAVRVFFQSGLILSLGILIGASPATGPIGFLAILGIAFLWGMGFAGYSVAAGIRSGSAQGAQAATFLFFPALFIAPTFVPREALSGWLSSAAAFNPTTYVIEAMRGIMIDGWISESILKGVIASGLFALITLTFAVIAARKVTEKN
ncbi:MAG: ABC transporter [Acidiferrobacteraceae bacterium]|nr:ABC transporter [Acidiferrobacteraceae bacterium]|tara:strand:- start:3443 stop:4252 length:810 start_codon:yes stop_codon:yes gene_type:complete